MTIVFALVGVAIVYTLVGALIGYVLARMERKFRERLYGDWYGKGRPDSCV